jgi:hypothetical protein
MPFAPDFQPVVRIDEFLRLMPVGKFARVIYIEPIPLIEEDFGAFSAGQTKSNVELTDLYMPKGELAQYRFAPVDDVQVIAFYQPGKRPKWITKNTGGKMIRLADYANAAVEKLNLTEFFQYEDTKLYVDLYAASDLTTSRIRFYGFRYVLEELEAAPPVYTTIWYEGLSPKGK